MGSIRDKLLDEMYDDFAQARKLRPERDTYKGSTALVKNNTFNYFPNKTEIAEYVSGRIRSSKPNSRLTIIIEPARSGGFCASTATVTLSEDGLIQKSSTGLDVT
jgi:hypothetical protein